LGASVRRNQGREQALRVRLERRDGALIATPNGPQGSHLVSSLVGADALAFIPPGEGELKAGATVVLERLAR
jgi:molybdopterin molybdotransferase